LFLLASVQSLLNRVWHINEEFGNTL